MFCGCVTNRFLVEGLVIDDCDGYYGAIKHFAQEIRMRGLAVVENL